MESANQDQINRYYRLNAQYYFYKNADPWKCLAYYELLARSNFARTQFADEDIQKAVPFVVGMIQEDVLANMDSSWDTFAWY